MSRDEEDAARPEKAQPSPLAGKMNNPFLQLVQDPTAPTYKQGILARKMHQDADGKKSECLPAATRGHLSAHERGVCASAVLRDTVQRDGTGGGQAAHVPSSVLTVNRGLCHVLGVGEGCRDKIDLGTPHPRTPVLWWELDKHTSIWYKRKKELRGVGRPPSSTACAGGQGFWFCFGVERGGQDS